MFGEYILKDRVTFGDYPFYAYGKSYDLFVCSNVQGSSPSLCV